MDSKAVSLKKPPRSVGIDLLRLFASFCVICLHTTQIDIMKTILNPIGHTAVPCFFMITGYFFCRDEIDNKRILKQITTLFKILMIWQFVYFIYEVFFVLKTPLNGVPDYIAQKISAEGIQYYFITTYLFGRVSYFTYGWFLFAQIQVFLVFLILKKFISIRKKQSIIIFLVSITLFISLFLGSWDRLLFPEGISSCFQRSWLFSGLPAFLIGGLVYYNRERLTKIKFKVLISAVLIAYFETIFEFELIKRIFGSESTTGNLSISTPILSAALFVIALKIESSENAIINFCAALGRKYSLGIYVVHRLIYLAIYGPIQSVLVNKNILLQYLIPAVSPFVIFLASLFVTFVFEELKDKIIKLLQKRKNNK